MSVHTIHGPVYMSGIASLDEVPTFVRPGAVVPLAPVVQYTDALPGGPLEVQVYAGADGSFKLVEDDGETTSYERLGYVRETEFSWSDGLRTLSWSSRQGRRITFENAFTQLYVTLFR